MKQKKTINTDFNTALLNDLVDFYKQEQNIKLLLQYINGYKDKKNKINISLRLIDWFIIYYSNKNTITIKLNKDKKIQLFNIYTSYKQQLKSYSKELFDPFRRNNKIFFTATIDDNAHNISTTLGQLNFFRWLIEHQIFDYIVNNFQIINKAFEKFKKDKAEQTIKEEKKTIVAATQDLKPKKLSNQLVVIKKKHNINF